VAISSTLFTAILAMDTYNRGYSPGLSLTGGKYGASNRISPIEERGGGGT
jgi:hypothetical protein